MRRKVRILAGLVWAMAACGPSITLLDGGESGAASTAGSETGSAPTMTMTTTTATPASTSTSVGGTAAESDDESELGDADSDSDFILRTDGWACGALPPGTLGHCSYCDTWQQDCPEGEKCMPWASDGGASWDSTRCAQIDRDPDQPGESCTVDGSAVSGLDSCEFGSMCFFVDSETLAGTCVEMCSGSSSDPLCPEGTHCAQSSGPLALCIPHCDPLAPECDPDFTCQPSSWEGFSCVQALGEPAGAGEPCKLNSCANGLVCLDGELVGCQTASCCTPYCDLAVDEPNPACGSGPVPQVCTPFYEVGQAPPSYTDVGVCLAAP